MTPDSRPLHGDHDSARTALRDMVHLFTYGALMDGGAALPDGCTPVRAAAVRGMLYDIGGAFPALMLAGEGVVHGRIWCCTPEHIHELDRHAAVRTRLFRRVGLDVDGTGCWTYVAGPALGARLARARRLETGRWTASTGDAGTQDD